MSVAELISTTPPRQATPRRLAATLPKFPAIAPGQLWLIEALADGAHSASARHAIDGANVWQSFWKITLPLLQPTTFFIFVTSLIGAFQVFDVVYVMTGGGPAGATTTLVHQIYNAAFKALDMGYAAAMSFVLFGIVRPGI